MLALLEARIDEMRRCPHCTVDGAARLSTHSGTLLARLRKKKLWAAFAEGLADGDRVKRAAERCGVADTTSFRWRHGLLAAIAAGSIKFQGIAEADETDVLASRNGVRKLDRKPRKRGGVAQKRGLSKEQVPIHQTPPVAGTVAACLGWDSAAELCARPRVRRNNESASSYC